MTAWRLSVDVWRRNRSWLWPDVLAPFAITRLALILVAWFSQYLPANTGYPYQPAIERGWHFSPHRLVDVWGRWDTGWYISIIETRIRMENRLA
jgi:hypothetical protein